MSKEEQTQNPPPESSGAKNSPSGPTQSGLSSEEIKLEIFKTKIDLLKFFLGSVVVAGVTFLGKNALENRDMAIKERESIHATELKERESARQELEQLGKYIQYALSENVATRERFARYFWHASRSPEAKQGWKAYLDDVITEKAEAVAKADDLEKLHQQLAEAAQKDKTKTAELRRVTNLLLAAKAELIVSKVGNRTSPNANSQFIRGNAFAEGGTGVGVGIGTGGNAAGEGATLEGRSELTTGGASGSGSLSVRK